MKSFKLYLCIILFAIPVYSFAISSNSYSDPEYLKAIEKVLTKMDSAKNVADYQQCRNSFERISNKYTKEWLAIYYTAYADMQMVYMNPKDANNESRLNGTKLLIEKLNSLSEADKSEVSTLWGYYYTALIMLDPQVNGQKYFNDAISNYEKGIKENENNPRPVFLLALFEQNLPPFLQSKRIFCDEIGKARELFEKEERSIEKPYWGKAFFEVIATKCEK